MGIISAFTIWVTYSDRNAMNADRKAMQDDYKQTIKELKEEIKSVKTESEQSIEKIKQNAEGELQRVNFSTNRIALEETQKQLSNIFGTEKIQYLIKEQAVKEVKNKVVDIVTDETKNFYSISNAATQMRLGKYQAMEDLKEYAESLSNIRDRETAKQLYTQICEEYQKNIVLNVSISTTTTDPLQYYKISIYKEKYKEAATTLNTNDEKYKNITNAEIIEHVIKLVNDKTRNLNEIATYIAVISQLSNNDFRAFEIEKINNWHRKKKMFLK
jgi:hypothetical protein